MATKIKKQKSSLRDCKIVTTMHKGEMVSVLVYRCNSKLEGQEDYSNSIVTIQAWVRDTESGVIGELGAYEHYEHSMDFASNCLCMSFIAGFNRAAADHWLKSLKTEL